MTIIHVLRRLVYDRAKGCCEYCLTPEVAVFASHEVDHIIAAKHGAEIVPLTPIGRVTVQLLQLNRRDRLQERQLLLEAGLLNLL